MERSTNQDERSGEAQRWLRFASEDLAVAENLAKNELRAPRHRCWLAQQAAEKAIKAALILDGVSFPFRHDLDVLRNLLPVRWALRETFPDLAELTEWAVEARYPGDWEEATEDEAERAVAQAKGVLLSVQTGFKCRDAAGEVKQTCPNRDDDAC